MAARRLQAVIRTLEHERDGYPDEHIELQKVIRKKVYNKKSNKVTLSQQESFKNSETQGVRIGVKVCNTIQVNNTNQNHSKWDRFKNLFKRQHKSAAKQNDEECHIVTSNVVKPKPVKKRKFFRNIQKFFRKNKIAPMTAGTSCTKTQVAPSQKSQMRNRNTYYAPVKVTSTTSMTLSMTSSFCSTEFNYEGCEIENNYEVYNSLDNINGNSESSCDIHHDVPSFSGTIDKTEHFVTKPLQPPVTLVFKAPICKTKGIPKRLLRTKAQVNEDEILMKHINAEANKIQVLKQRMRPLSRQGQKVDETKILHEQSHIEKQNELQRKLEAKKIRIAAARDKTLQLKQQTLREKHEHARAIYDAHVIIDPLNRPVLPPIPGYMVIPAVNASATAVKPVLRKRKKDKTPIDQEKKLLLAENRRRNYLFEKVRPASRHNQRVNEVKTRVQTPPPPPVLSTPPLTESCAQE